MDTYRLGTHDLVGELSDMIDDHGWEPVLSALCDALHAMTTGDDCSYEMMRLRAVLHAIDHAI